MVRKFFNSVLPCDTEVAGWWTNLVMAYWYDFATFLAKPERLQAVNEARLLLLTRLTAIMQENNNRDARINLQCQVTTQYARIDLRYQQAVLLPFETKFAKQGDCFSLDEQIMQLNCDSHRQTYHLTLTPSENL